MTPRGLIAASNPEEQISQASAADGGRLPVGYEVDELNKPKMATNPPQGPRRPNRTFPQKDADLDPHPQVKIVGPHMGKKPIAAIEAPDLLAVLRKLEKRGVNDTAHRVRAVCGRVFRYAIATGRAKHDISADLKGALAPKGTISYAAITDPGGVGKLLRAIDGFGGQRTTYAALRLAPYVFVRPGELRGAEWSEISFELSEWRIPAARMKMKEQHVVPLARQVIEILRELQIYTGRGRFVFLPSGVIYGR
jgi:integrase